MKTNILKAGKTFYNNNGEEYTILYVNNVLDRTLLLSPYGHYIGAWAISCSQGCWSQGHYFMEDFESAVNYVLGKELKKPKISNDTIEEVKRFED